MSAPEKGPAYVISLIAGALILVGGLVRAASAGVLPPRAYGTGFRLMSTTFRSADLIINGSLLELSAIVAIVAGIVVLVGAVMLSSQSRWSGEWGAVIIAFSAISLIGGGGFFIGAILGILAGIIAVTWKSKFPSSR